MARKFAKYFHQLVQEIITDNDQRDKMFGALRIYQSSQDLKQLLSDLKQLLDEPQKLELYEYIRPLILLRHQLEYSYRAPAIPGLRLRTVRLFRTHGKSLGFGVRGGFEFGVGVFVSTVEHGSQAEEQGLKVGDEIIRVNGFTIAEAIHEDVLKLIKSRDEIVLKVTYIGMLPVKEQLSHPLTWKYVEDMESKPALDEVLKDYKNIKGKYLELKIFIDSTGTNSIGCGILSGPSHYPGIFVEKVRPGSLAEEVGFEVGDQIKEVNEKSFLGISHNEAVVVLKSSKQLNVVICKRAGLRLFEKRQQASSNSSHQVGDNSSISGSQRSSSKSTIGAKNWDESQLIAETLGRNQLFHHSTSSSNNMKTEQYSTYAQVHSNNNIANRNSDFPIPVEKFSALELNGRELKSFLYSKDRDLGIEMEGGIGTPLAGKIVVAAVFDGGVAIEHGIQTGDQLMMINGKKLTDLTIAQAEQVLKEAQTGPQDKIQVVYTQSAFLNNEECVTYF